MRKVHIGLLISAGLLAGVSQASPLWTYTYDADRLPDASGSIKDATLTPYSAFLRTGSVTSEGIAGDIYSGSTINSNGGCWFHRTTAPDALASLNSDTGYTMEARIKIDAIDEDLTNAGIGAVAIQCDEGRAGIDRFWQLGFDVSGGQYQVALKGGGGPEYVNIDNTAFHTYRVTVLGNTATLYIDGNPTPAASVPNLRNLATNEIEFGDFTGVGDGAYQMDYLSVYDGGAVAVPEPASCAALSLGGLAMMWRRRR
jgi:hypothetical protein